MKRLINFALVACMLVYCGSVFAQEAKDDAKPSNEIVVKIEQNKKNPPFKLFKPRIPHRVKNAVDFFKLADELELTDDQLIQLRGYYKKHFANPQKKIEKITKPTSEDFYKMTEEEMNKFAEAESKKVHDAIMSALQKIIDIKKILSPEQLQKLKTMARDDAKKALAKMAEARKKAREQQMKDNDCANFKHGMMPWMNPNKPGMKGDFGFAPWVRPMMNKKGDFQPQMGPQCPMMGGHHGMMPQMGPRCPMMGGHHGMMPQMGPRCPMMGGHRGMHSQMGPRCPMMGGCNMPLQMGPGMNMNPRNHKMGKRPDMKRPGCFHEWQNCDDRSFFNFLKKFFDCQKNKKGDIIDSGKKNPKFDSLKKDGEKLPPLHMNKPEGPKAAPEGAAKK